MKNENGQTRGTAQIAVLAIVLGVVLLGIGAWYFNGREQPKAVVNTNNAVDINVTANGNANVSTNENTNTTVRTNTNVSSETRNEKELTYPFEPVAQPEKETIVYNLGGHAFQFETPTAWNVHFVADGDRSSLEKYKEPMTLLQNRQTKETLIDFSFAVLSQSETDLDALVSNKLKETQKDYPNAVKVEHRIGGEKALRIESVSAWGDKKGIEYSDYVEHGEDRYRINISSRNDSANSQLKEDFERLEETFVFLVAETPDSIVPPRIITKVSDKQMGLHVDWLDEPLGLNVSDPIVSSSEEREISSRMFYQVGVVRGGVYDGQSLVNILEIPYGMSMQPNLYRTIYDSKTGKLVYLEKHSDNLSRLPSAIYYDTGATIENLEMPKMVRIPGSDVQLKAETFQLRQLLGDQGELLVALKNTSVGTIYYLPEKQCFIAETPDHLLQQYSYATPFTKETGQAQYIRGMNFFVPSITWSDGSKNSTEYTMSEYGPCGSALCLNVVAESSFGGVSGLTKIGTTSTGDSLYLPKDASAKFLQNVYESFDNTLYDKSKKMSYEDFLAQRSVFLWEDPFGQWVQFQRTDVLPQVECGKPVIYLYPEKEQQVNVQVQPNGGFTVTDPVYPDGGWNVTASPDGVLRTADGKTYSSLFWEGKGIFYERPKRGFVVRREEVNAFLDGALAKLGLNEQERKDFKEFWVPRMQQKPYVFVTFVDQKAFDTIAPLTVTPTPETIIRVFMDYEPLDEPIEAEPLDIVTPERTGFSVVEWGGALHK